jgi:hypothetical protein
LAEPDEPAVPDGSGEPEPALDASTEPSASPSSPIPVAGIAPKPGKLDAATLCETSNPEWKRVESSERGIATLVSESEFIVCHVSTADVVYCDEIPVSAGEFPSDFPRFESDVVDLGIGHRALALLDSEGRVRIQGSDVIDNLDGTFRQLEGPIALDAYGTLFQWSVYDSPVQRAGPPGTFRQVSAYDGGFCALDLDGEISCWSDESSPLGPQPPGPFEFISASRFGHCAIRDGDELYCWQGAEPFEDWGEFNGRLAREVSNAEGSICIRTVEGEARCWSSGLGHVEVGECFPPPAR